MVEIPEHLLKRSQEARARLGEGAPAPSSEGESAQPADVEETAPAEPAEATAEAPPADAPATPAAASAPAPPSPPASERRPAAAASSAPAARGAATAVAARPAAAPARTQRLLTVVKSGSIQQVKAEPGDKVNVWPHLLQAEFVSLLIISAFLIVFSIFKQAPLQAEANFNLTPNPSKAPWYFLGLQELLSYFDPQVAGVLIPGIGIIGLMAVPYIDRNPSHHPEDRKIAIVLFSFFLMFWATLVIFGSFFRGPGFNFTYPWSNGLFFDF
jgi:quinol---cytochrome c reductase cytochrome c subunit, bacillus type